MAGPEKKDRVISDKKKELVAYHEAGHALVGALMPDYDPVAKVSIIPRGQAGGLTFLLQVKKEWNLVFTLVLTFKIKWLWLLVEELLKK